MRPSEYFRRQVRVSSFSYEMPARLIRQTGDLYMCCSDYPHSEGTATPLADYTGAAIPVRSRRSAGPVPRQRVDAARTPVTARSDPYGPPRHDVPTRGHSAFTVVGSRQVHYLAWGRRGASPVVCLHGGGQTAYMYEELGAALGDRWFVLAPDLPGHGDSDLDASANLQTGGLDRRALAASIVAFVDFVGIERAAFVGASLGGITSLTIAAMHPARVAAVALIDIGHRLEDDGVRRIVEFMTRHESFGSLDEAAAAIAEYLPGRKQQSPGASHPQPARTARRPLGVEACPRSQPCSAGAAAAP